MTISPRTTSGKALGPKFGDVSASVIVNHLFLRGCKHTPDSLHLTLLDELCNANKALGYEGGTADQGTVDVRL